MAQDKNTTPDEASEIEGGARADGRPFPEVDTEVSGVTVETSDSIEAVAPAVDTDQSLIKTLYPDAHVICSADFMKVSANSYPLPWLVRELAQNFVDANPGKNHGTLNGVQIVPEQGEDGKSRFRLIGDWPFPRPEGLIGLHSGKPSGTHAGGNGIGLKQTVLRFMRDFGVEHFVIEGEKWEVRYELLSADQANASLEERRLSEGKKVKHSWLIAHASKSLNTGKNAYVIETKNENVIRALSTFPELAVCDENPYLKDPDIKNDKGILKWMPPADDSENPGSGRLFINGQVMHFGRKLPEEEGYWGPTPGVSLSLNDLKYEISIDRPPLKNQDLTGYLNAFIQTLSPGDCRQQIVKSRALWTQISREEVNQMIYTYHSWPVWVIVLSQIIRRSDLDASGFSSVAGQGDYVYVDRQLSEQEFEELQQGGYTICPSPFKKVSLEPASHQLESYKRARQRLEDGLERAEDPAVLHENLQEMASKTGAFVAYPHLTEIRNANGFVDHFGGYCRQHNISCADQDLDTGISRFRVKSSPFHDHSLHTSPLSRANNSGYPDQKLIYELRGLIAKGFEHSVFESVYLTSGNHVVVFSRSSSGDLMVRITERELASQGVELTVQCNPQTGYGQQMTEALKVSPTKSSRMRWRGTPALARIPALGGALAVGALGLWLAGVKPSVPSPDILNLPAETFSLKGLASSLSDERGGARGFEGSSNGGQVDQTRKALQALLERHAQGGADAHGPDPDVEAAKRQLEGMIAHHSVKDLEMLPATPEQQEQMELLRRFFELATGVQLTHEFLVFRGKGADGFNKGAIIALHEKLFKGSFDEALSVVWHEAAHTVRGPHDETFMNTLQALAACTVGSLRAIAQKSAGGGALTAPEQKLLRIPKAWGELAR
jgi:hypothetical protein